VLVDTPIWLLALRRRSRSADDPAIAELASLIQDGRAALIGAIRQELLSGIREGVHLERVRDHLRAFPDLEVMRDDYEQAASFVNVCRAKGIQGSNTDFLICAIAARIGSAIFTTDADFTRFARLLPIVFHPVA
jgi:predicted nucleic acid-binding protein